MTEIQWGYRTVEGGHSEEVMLGSGYAAQKLSENKVRWLNENCSGQHTLIQRRVIFGEWREVK